MTDEIIRTEENGVEFFTVVATGESGLSGSGIARSLNVNRKNLVYWIAKIEKSVASDDLPESLQPLHLKPLSLASEIKYKNARIFNANVWAAFAEYFAIDSTEPTKEARSILRAINRIGAESYIQGKTGWLPSEYQSNQEARSHISRILEKPCVWDALYSKEVAYKGFSWFGTNFYWRYFYYWMTPEERCQLETSNPAIKGTRKYKIHQLIESITRDRLREKAIELGVLIKQSNCRESFERNFFATYGQGWQQELFN